MAENRHPTPLPGDDPDKKGIVRLSDDKGKRHAWDKPANVKRLTVIFVTTCLALMLLDTFFVLHVVHKHLSFEEGVFPPEAWLGFFAVYGFIACTLIVLIARALRKVLMRPEDYYDK